MLWVTTYFGACRYDGRHWRGFFDHECGLPSNFNNAVKGRTANEAWFCTDKGLGVLADFETDTWGDVHLGSRQAQRQGRHPTGQGNPGRDRNAAVTATQLRACGAEFDGDDAWLGTSKGLGHAIGQGYYPGLRPESGKLALRPKR